MKLAIAATALLTTVLSTAHSASAETVPTEDTIDAANDAGLDPADVQGALNTLRPSHPDLDAQTYVASLAMALSDAPAQGVSEDGGRAFPAAPVSALAARVACIERKESGGANVWNRSGSGAAGVLQYMGGTFARGAREMGHPEWSRWNPDEARAVAAHDLALGRRSQWTVAGC